MKVLALSINNFLAIEAAIDIGVRGHGAAGTSAPVWVLTTSRVI